jgi:hypothetical protein
MRGRLGVALVWLAVAAFAAEALGLVWLAYRLAGL